MKNFINFASGFTIAELLISLLISAILAAAMVPVIGIKKIKNPIIKYNHGIAECYYNESGQLTYYYETNRKSERNGTQVINGSDHCSFLIPKAQYFQIFVIGAGSDSAGSRI